MARIFVRNRREDKGAGKPRFAVVAVEGLDLKLYTKKMRRKELEALAEATGAEVIYLPRGDDGEDDLPGEGGGGMQRRRQGGPAASEE
jgi:hypothetical protein